MRGNRSFDVINNVSFVLLSIMCLLMPLKLLGMISLSWVVVFAPLWIHIVCIFGVFVAYMIIEMVQLIKQDIKVNGFRFDECEI